MSVSNKLYLLLFIKYEFAFNFPNNFQTMSNTVGMQNYKQHKMYCICMRTRTNCTSRITTGKMQQNSITVNKFLGVIFDHQGRQEIKTIPQTRLVLSQSTLQQRVE